MCVEWNCHYFFSLFFICHILACMWLLVLPYYMVNKDEYILDLFACSTSLLVGWSVHEIRIMRLRNCISVDSDLLPL